jgi:hypothetical protein
LERTTASIKRLSHFHSTQVKQAQCQRKLWFDSVDLPRPQTTWARNEADLEGKASMRCRSSYGERQGKRLVPCIICLISSRYSQIPLNRGFW